MTPRGGPRPRSGRPATGRTTVQAPFALPPALIDRMRALLDPGESLAKFAAAGLSDYCDQRERDRDPDGLTVAERAGR